MRHTFGQYWSCHECGCHTMIVGPQQYDGEDFVELEAIENDPEIRAKVDASQFAPAVYIADYSNITCDVCSRRISKEEWKKVHKSIPHVPFSEWTFTEEIGVCIVNSDAIKNVSVTKLDNTNT